MKEHAENALCADDIFASAESLLRNPDASQGELLSVCNNLVQIGEQTWWRCGCGSIRPDSGEIDVYCSHCKEFRHLPERLSRSPWPLYVQCLMRLMPDTWFDTLENWLCAQGLAHDEHGSETHGHTEHSRAIHCVDGMIILDTGEIRGLQWIALPMMEPEAN